MPKTEPALAIPVSILFYGVCLHLGKMHLMEQSFEVDKMGRKWGSKESKDRESKEASIERHCSHWYASTLLPPGLPMWWQEEMDNRAGWGGQRTDLSRGDMRAWTGWQQATWLLTGPMTLIPTSGLLGSEMQIPFNQSFAPFPSPPTLPPLPPLSLPLAVNISSMILALNK